MFSIQFIFIYWTEFILPEQGFYAFLKDAADLKVLKVGSGTGSVNEQKHSHRGRISLSKGPVTWNFHSPLCWNLLTSLQATMPCIRRLLLWLCGKYLLLGVKIQFWDYGLKSVSDWRNRCRVCPALYLSILYFVFNVLYCFMYCTVLHPFY